MSILDKVKNLGDKLKLRKFESSAKLVSNDKSILEARLAAMEYLFAEAEDVTSKNYLNAWFALMKRWNISVDHTLHDEREKNEVRDRLISIGPKSVELVKAFCKKEKKVSKWAAEVIFHYLSESEGVEFLASVLEFNDVYISSQQAEKDLEILQMFRLKKGEAAVNSAITYLKSPDHLHRLTAIEILEFQGVESSSLKHLITVLSEDESGRIKQRILELFVRKSWNILEYKDLIIANVPNHRWIIKPNGTLFAPESEINII